MAGKLMFPIFNLRLFKLRHFQNNSNEKLCARVVDSVDWCRSVALVSHGYRYTGSES